MKAVDWTVWEVGLKFACRSVKSEGIPSLPSIENTWKSVVIVLDNFKLFQLSYYSAHEGVESRNYAHHEPKHPLRTKIIKIFGTILVSVNTVYQRKFSSWNITWIHKYTFNIQLTKIIFRNGWYCTRVSSRSRLRSFPGFYSFIVTLRIPKSVNISIIYKLW